MSIHHFICTGQCNTRPCQGKWVHDTKLELQTRCNYVTCLLQHCCMSLQQCCISVAALLHVCCNSVACYRHTCNIQLSAYMQHSCNIAATYMQHTCNEHATHMQRACSGHAADMQRTCNKWNSCRCNMHATCMLGVFVGRYISLGYDGIQVWARGRGGRDA